MKILKIDIYSSNEELIRSINFKEVGISFVYADIKKENEKGETINSLGKTLLLKMIDYMYGANEDKKIMKDKIKNYKINALIKYKDEVFNVKRIIGASNEIFINDSPYSLTKYKSFFDINRNFLDKQIFLSSKESELSKRSNVSIDDYKAFFKLMNLNNLIEDMENIYKNQDKIKKYNDSIKLLFNVSKEENKKLQEKIFYIEDKIKNESKKLSEIEDKIKNIEFTEIQSDIIINYEKSNSKFKYLKTNIEKLKIEKNRLNSFIESSNKSDIKPEHIISIYKKAQIEVPDMVKKRLDEVEKFHNVVFEERKEFIGKKLISIQEDINLKMAELEELSKESDKLGKIISNDKIYKNAMDLYQVHNEELQKLNSEKFKLLRRKEIDSSLNELDRLLTNDFDSLTSKLFEYSKLIEKYRNFVNDLSKEVYSHDVSTYFNIEVNKKHKIRRPIKFDFNMSSDSGEGIGEVKKCFMDYLIFKHNNYIEILIQDSSCYNGIDARQIENMLNKLNEISIFENKQVIISINKFQLGGIASFIDFVEQNKSIELSENNKLLKMDF